MKKVIGIFVILLVLVNLFLASWSVLHNELYFSSDIARDFLLLQELNQKKFVLIGPRSSVQGLFHGPAWMYLNFPAYKIGNGNPIAVGWFWIFLMAACLLGYYVIAKKLFDQTTAYLFVLMSSLYFVFIANGLFNPYGAMFVLPFFFYFFVRYVQTKEVKHLCISILLCGLLIQFQMAVGIPFFILTLLYDTVFALKNKKPAHLFAFLLILIPLSTFILFDVKHNFLMFHNALRQVGTSDPHQTFSKLIRNRVQNLFEATEFLRYGIANGSLYVSLFFFALLITLLKSGKNQIVYRLFLYFYLGFFILSLINKYDLLYFYIFPLFTFVFFIFCSLVNSKYKYLFLAVFTLIYLTNFQGALQNAKDIQNSMGTSETSWQGMLRVANSTFKGNEQSFGYFVYSPDVLGYQAKYAMEYTKTLHQNKIANSFEKQSITYLIFAPPPRNNPLMRDTYWTTVQVGIKSKPVEVKHFSNGYRVEKYELSKTEQAVPFDPSINPGLTFR